MIRENMKTFLKYSKAGYNNLIIQKIVSDSEKKTCFGFE
jgi:hypothetical protein